MGQQARHKRKQHELRRSHQEQMRVMHAAAGEPQTQARLAEFHDEECRTLKEADRGGQAHRLEGQGWKLREPNLDGLGVWDHRRWRLRLIHSIARELDGQVWAHVSVSNPENTMPHWYQVR